MSKYLAFLEMGYIQHYNTDEERQNLIDSYKEKWDGITIVDSKEGETSRQFIDEIMRLTNTKYVVEDAYTGAIYLYKYLEQVLEVGIPLSGIVNIGYLGNIESDESYNKFKEIIRVKDDINDFLIDKKKCFKSRLLKLERDITKYHEDLLKTNNKDELNEIMGNLKNCLIQIDYHNELLKKLG